MLILFTIILFCVKYNKKRIHKHSRQKCRVRNNTSISYIIVLMTEYGIFGIRIPRILYCFFYFLFSTRLVICALRSMFALFLPSKKTHMYIYVYYLWD